MEAGGACPFRREARLAAPVRAAPGASSQRPRSVSEFRALILIDPFLLYFGAASRSRPRARRELRRPSAGRPPPPPAWSQAPARCRRWRRSKTQAASVRMSVMSCRWLAGRAYSLFTHEVVGDEFVELLLGGAWVELLHHRVPVGVWAHRRAPAAARCAGRSDGGAA